MEHDFLVISVENLQEQWNVSLSIKRFWGKGERWKRKKERAEGAYCVLSNHYHIQILDVSHDLLNGFVSGLPFSFPPPPSPISNLLSPSHLGRPDTQANGTSEKVACFPGGNMANGNLCSIYSKPSLVPVSALRDHFSVRCEQRFFSCMAFSVYEVIPVSCLSRSWFLKGRKQTNYATDKTPE